MKVNHILNSKRDLKAFISRSKQSFIKEYKTSSDYAKFFSFVEKIFVKLVDQNKLKSREEIMNYTFKVCYLMNFLRKKREIKKRIDEIKRKKKKLRVVSV